MSRAYQLQKDWRLAARLERNGCDGIGSADRGAP